MNRSEWAGSWRLMRKYKCLADDVEAVAAVRMGGSGMASGARRGWRWRKIGRVVTGILAGRCQVKCREISQRTIGSRSALRIFLLPRLDTLHLALGGFPSGIPTLYRMDVPRLAELLFRPSVGGRPDDDQFSALGLLEDPRPCSVHDTFDAGVAYHGMGEP